MPTFQPAFTASPTLVDLQEQCRRIEQSDPKAFPQATLTVALFDGVDKGQVQKLVQRFHVETVAEKDEIVASNGETMSADKSVDDVDSLFAAVSVDGTSAPNGDRLAGMFAKALTDGKLVGTLGHSVSLLASGKSLHNYKVASCLLNRDLVEARGAAWKPESVYCDRMLVTGHHDFIGFAAELTRKTKQLLIAQQIAYSEWFRSRARAILNYRGIRSVAADNVQFASFQKLARATQLPDFTSMLGSTRYVDKVIRNCAYDLLKREQRRAGYPLHDDEAIAVLTNLDKTSESDFIALMDAIQRLPEGERAVIDRLYFGGALVKDLAEQLKVNVRTILRWRNSALRRLAEDLEGLR